MPRSNLFYSYHDLFLIEFVPRFRFLSNNAKIPPSSPFCSSKMFLILCCSSAAHRRHSPKLLLVMKLLSSSMVELLLLLIKVHHIRRPHHRSVAVHHRRRSCPITADVQKPHLVGSGRAGLGLEGLKSPKIEKISILFWIFSHLNSNVNSHYPQNWRAIIGGSTMPFLPPFPSRPSVAL